MANSPQSKSAILHGSVDEVGQNGELSVTTMKTLLQRAEQRLTGPTTLQTQPSKLHGKAERTPPSHVPTLARKFPNESYIRTASGVARIDPAKTIDDNERRLASQTRQVAVGGDAVNKTRTKTTSSTAGLDWFHLPRTNLTPELKRDLQLLKMRSTWDPKRHYKNDSRRPLVPEYSQIGTIIEGPTEHFSSRIAKRDRKKSFVDEIRAAEDSSGRFKNKSIEIQASKTSGRRAFCNSLKQKRSKRSIRS
ncbi:MAG: hypothetical protein Q9213_000044 [Squamulea squamosa]